MNGLMRVSILVVAAAAIAGCGSTPTRTRHVSPEHDAAMIGQIKLLEGTWMMQDENGQEIVGTVYRPTSAGSAVQEVMFPGTEHEMVNVYHMDGEHLVVTHFCAVGNQPRMVARAAETNADGATVYRFVFDRASNWRPEHDHCMGGLTLTIDGNRLVQTWESLDAKGKPAGSMEFELVRK